MKHLILAFATLYSFEVSAQFGTLDGDFDADGIKTATLAGEGGGYGALVQPDGKILFCGEFFGATETGILVGRLFPDGSYDASFGTNGLALVDLPQSDEGLFAMTFQSDGKIVGVGQSDEAFIIVRLGQSGQLDPTFGTNGYTITLVGEGSNEAKDLVVLPSGKILVTGRADNGAFNDVVLLRFNQDGTLDNTFSFDGVVITDIENHDNSLSLVAHDNGKITIAGHDGPGSLFLIRYNEDGTLDNSFGTTGKLLLSPGGETGSLEGLELDVDGKLVATGFLSGSTNYDFAVMRFNPDGTLDNTFSFDGMVTTDFDGASDQAKDVKIQPDGKILVVGNVFQGQAGIGLIRYNTDGTLDTGFGTNGKVVTTYGSYDYGESLALQPDGKAIVVGYTNAGNFYPIILRYITGVNIGIGEVDAHIGSTLIYPNPITNNQVTVEYELKSDETVSIELFDLSGKMVAQLQPSVHQKAGSYQETLVLPNLTSGNYLLNLTTEKGSVSVRIAVN